VKRKQGPCVKATNLAPGVAPATLKEALTAWGVTGIGEVSMATGRMGQPIAFLSFKSVDEAELMMQASGVRVEGRPLVLELQMPVTTPATASKGGSSTSRARASTTTLKVSNLPEKVTHESLKTFLRQHGVLGIAEVNILEDGQSGYVRFKEPEKVNMAILKTSGASFEGKPVRLEPEPPAPSSYHWEASENMDEDQNADSGGDEAIPKGNVAALMRNIFGNTPQGGSQPPEDSDFGPSGCCGSECAGAWGMVEWRGGGGGYDGGPGEGWCPPGPWGHGSGWGGGSGCGWYGGGGCIPALTWFAGDWGPPSSGWGGGGGGGPGRGGGGGGDGPSRPPSWMIGEHFIRIRNLPPGITAEKLERELACAGLDYFGNVFIDMEAGGTTGFMSFRRQAEVDDAMHADGSPIDGYKVKLERYQDSDAHGPMPLSVRGKPLSNTMRVAGESLRFGATGGGNNGSVDNQCMRNEYCDDHSWGCGGGGWADGWSSGGSGCRWHSNCVGDDGGGASLGRGSWTRPLSRRDGYGTVGTCEHDSCIHGRGHNNFEDGWTSGSSGASWNGGCNSVGVAGCGCPWATFPRAGGDTYGAAVAGVGDRRAGGNRQSPY